MRAPVQLFAVLVLALAGCGGDDGGNGDGGSGQEDAVKEVVRNAEADPDKLCTGLATRELVEQTGGRKACLKRPSRGIEEGEDYTIEKVVVRGERATVEVDVKGTTANDETLTLLKRDGRWRVSGVR